MEFVVRNYRTLLCLVILFAGPWVPAVLGAFKPAVVNDIDCAIECAISEQRLPGAIFWLEHRGAIYHKAYGRRAFAPHEEAMTDDTVFDIASLTKVVATAPSIMILMERGQLNINSPVQKYLPEFQGTNKDGVTIRQLLTHTSGLPSSYTLERPHDYKSAIDLALREPLKTIPDTTCTYSDLGYILLGEIVHRISGTNLDAFALANIFIPLRMNTTLFRPKAPDMIAPTRRSRTIQDRTEVHDPKARAMGGIAGHAGVFSTMPDLARFARMILGQGEIDGVRLLRRETVARMTQVQTPLQIADRRGLGWDIDTSFSRPRGRLFPVGSFGHTGFTGTSMWLDPGSGTFWILLSNRVYPDGRGHILNLQKELGTLSAEALEGINFSRTGFRVPEANVR